MTSIIDQSSADAQLLSGAMAAKALGVTSFTTVGHLLQINLKENLLAHKAQIGQALLSKNKRALAVINKVNSIDNEFRNFEIEILAKREGCDKTDEELMIVEVNENKCRFQMDFSKVYWNSRLSTEHERIIGKLNKPYDIVFDLFAGIGPFAVPAAKLRCQTYANDLNPEAVKWLEVNMKRNKVDKSKFEIHNMDAKDFILNNLKQKLVETHETFVKEQSQVKPRVHILMNLPALAPTFLPNFVGLFSEESSSFIKSFEEAPLDYVVYCYCFLKGNYPDPKAEVRKMIEGQLGKPLEECQLLEVFRVRNVAPYKEMYRVDIKLDSMILLSQLQGDMQTVGEKPDSCIAVECPDDTEAKSVTEESETQSETTPT